MNKIEKKILEKYFGVNAVKYSNGDYIMLEQWTNGGVDMIIEFEKGKNVISELENYIENFDIDEEIELYRESKDYRDAFTITESVKDFEDWIKHVKNCLEELKSKEV